VADAARRTDELRSLARESRPRDVGEVTSIRDAVGETVTRPGRLELPVDDAGAIGALLFLERPASGSVAVQTVVIDGGFSAH
jgi:hypothetical protein